jgi:PadR family transcriptional regulator, regulatory protein AphA
VTEASLAQSAYVVLGLLDLYGPGTPYDLKRWVEKSVGYFWSFPRAQLYVEPQRLAALGLVEEVREAAGRRRRRFSITPAGRDVLRAWICSDAAPPAELRDPGLLKLFFAGGVETTAIVALARATVVCAPPPPTPAEHARRLADYERLLPTLEQDPAAVLALVTLRLGLRHERLAVEFWREVADDPPRPA